MTRPKPVVLLILDGWGYQPDGKDNAIHAASTPTWDAIWEKYPHTLISGCGEDVGLPAGQMGNSEVGHLTMGAGRTIYQDLTLISKEIREGAFFQNAILKSALEQAQQTGKCVHVLGLLSPGGVHSHEEHLFACLKMAATYSVKTYLHAFLDGRDTPPQSAAASLEKCEQVLKETQATLATLCGRYYAMDRDQRWERVHLAYDAIVHGQAPYYANSGLEALKQAYARQETDEFVKPTCITPANQEAVTVEPGDIIIYMNFRADRARALSQALTDPNFKGFERGNAPHLGTFVSLTEYDKNLKTNVAYPPQIHRNILGEYLQNLRLTQLHLAETEKYAHVTFFFNGGREAPFEGEERILIPSPKVATYDLQPEMSAQEITDVLIKQLYQQQFDFIVCNYANADMVGHSGNMPATIKAIETLDHCLSQIIPALEAVGGEALITSDHGNAECMSDPETGQPHTAHTTSLVPLVYIGQQSFQFISGGKLSDIAPTLLRMMGLQQPSEMTGHSLLIPMES